MENLSHHTAEPSVAVLLGGIVNGAKDLLEQIAPPVPQRQPA